MPEVKRTLVKSAPELWAEVSDPGALARRLAPFGSVRITRAEPEALIEWEGERASGAVRLDPSGFGTRVTLTAVPAQLEIEPEPEPSPPPRPAGPTPVEDPPPADPSPVQEPPPHDPSPELPPAAERPGFWARLRRRLRGEAARAAPASDPPPAHDRGLTPQDPIVQSTAPTRGLTPEGAIVPNNAAVGGLTPGGAIVRNSASVVPPAPRTVPAIEDAAAVAALTDVLDALGAAHHRPFSRA